MVSEAAELATALRRAILQATEEVVGADRAILPADVYLDGHAGRAVGRDVRV